MTTLYKKFKTALVALSLSIFVMQADVVAQNANEHSFDTNITAVSPNTTTSVKSVQTNSTVSSFLDYIFDFSSWIWGAGQTDEVLPKGPGTGDWEWDEIDDFGG